MDGLVEAARTAVGPAIVAPYSVDGTVQVVSFEPRLERQLLEAAEAILTQLAEITHQAEEQNLTPVLACAPQLRSAVRRMVEASVARLPVVSYTELSGPVQIRSIGIVNGYATAIGA